MNKIKNILCFILISAVLVSAICIPFGIKKSMGETVPSTSWNNNASSTLSTDASGAYLIKSSADLACFNKNLSTYASKTIKLMVDVDMSANKWETNQTKFNGVFEGNNKTISGIKYSGSSSHVGLFSTLNYNSKVQNVVLNNFYISQTIGAGATNHVGFLAGYIEGSALNVSNCTVKNSTIEYTASTSNSGSINAGGIGGFTYSSNLQYCYVVNSIIQATSGNKPNTARVGGIAGNANNSNITISCTIGSTINAQGYSYCYAGGIVGINTYANSPSGGTISKCFTEGGSVKSTTYAALANTFASNAGGIAGYLSYGSISNCYSASVTIQAINDASDETSTQMSSYSFNGANSWNTADIEENTDLGEATKQNQRLYRGDIDVGSVFHEWSDWNWGKLWSWPPDVSGFWNSLFYTDTSRQLSYIKIKNKTYKCSGGIVGYANSGTTISTCYSNSTIGNTSNTKYETTQLTYNLGFKEYEYREGINFKQVVKNVIGISFSGLGTANILWHTRNFSNNLIYNSKRTVGRIYGYAPQGYSLSNCYGASISADAVDFYSGGKHGANDGISYSLYKSGNSICIKSEWTADSDVPRNAGNMSTTLYTNSSGLTSPLNSYSIINRQAESLANTDINKITSASGSAFLTKSGVNGNKPFIRDFYWEYSAVMPAD